MEAGKIRCIIVDDEPMALRLMESYVSKTPFLELKRQCSNALDAMDYLGKEKIDLVFLDIQMPDLTGMELSRMLPAETRVVFTTAFDAYALEGFKVDALDYLLKPFNYAEFLSAATRAREWFALLRKKPEKQQEVAVRPGKEFLFVKSEYRQLKIRLDDVLYFEGLKDYIKIYVKGQSKPILTLMSLKALEAELPAEQFMRVHRSYIIALRSIDSVERSQVLIGDKRITVSEQYRAVFMAYISRNSLD
ncbi:two component transcriptional regulator, LytTR family [Sinomicrobium oceani]|uniref:Two component transcriptional regulator, LytTR family n=1 Tax=Sinomicrobium oceani TaxID=1150368 RepID=A0A1K1N463_9FLAO|nr:LytTR family DNA-binding domain-containing protein [Sinomicrobium oceani]SFW29102.1 two component transcriptional regulator, LytTR family [Sinomicrobium oceani]